MNLIAFGILMALAVPFLLNVLADILNLGAAESALPREVEGFYDAATYTRSQDYLRETTRLERISETFFLVLFLIFWFCRGFAWLDEWVRSLGFSPVLSGLIYIGLLAAAKGILGLLFSAYATFGIEARFGFTNECKII